jgi:hypothetical protein
MFKRFLRVPQSRRWPVSFTGGSAGRTPKGEPAGACIVPHLAATGKGRPDR